MQRSAPFHGRRGGFSDFNEDHSAAVIAFVVGAIATHLVSIGVFMAYVEMFKVVDRDGGMSMAAFLVLGPFSALVAGSSPPS